MNNSKNSVQAKIKNLSQKLDVSVNILLATYFFDAFLFRLSKSEYAENFIFKGGFYLSTMLGIQNRYTQDLDFKLSGQNLDKENLERMMKEIISETCDDDISFDLKSITPIREEDQYGGFTVEIIGHLENIKQPFSIDIATGDPITPGAITYAYKRLLQNDTINFKAYNLESILAEKIQTVYSRGLLNSRSKDFYDIYIIQKLKMNDIDVSHLQSAFTETCNYRNTHFTKTEALDLLEKLSKNETVSLRWKNYSKKNTFAKDISFSDVISSCKAMTEIIF